MDRQVKDDSKVLRLKQKGHCGEPKEGVKVVQTCERLGIGNKVKAEKIAKKTRPGQKSKGSKVSKSVETEGKVQGRGDGAPVQEVD